VGTVGLFVLNDYGWPVATQQQRSGFFDWALDTWYYLEMHVKLNTPGQSNGILQVWAGRMGAPGLADMLWVDEHNVNIRGAFTDPFNTIGLGYQVDKLGFVGWTEYRYLKNIALSTTRIGP
jgi:hypothetical protein